MRSSLSLLAVCWLARCGVQHATAAPDRGDSRGRRTRQVLLTAHDVDALTGPPRPWRLSPISPVVSGSGLDRPLMTSSRENSMVKICKDDENSFGSATTTTTTRHVQLDCLEADLLTSRSTSLEPLRRHHEQLHSQLPAPQHQAKPSVSASPSRRHPGESTATPPHCPPNPRARFLEMAKEELNIPLAEFWRAFLTLPIERQNNVVRSFHPTVEALLADLLGEMDTLWLARVKEISERKPDIPIPVEAIELGIYKAAALIFNLMQWAKTAHRRKVTQMMALDEEDRKDLFGEELAQIAAKLDIEFDPAQREVDELWGSLLHGKQLEQVIGGKTRRMSRSLSREMRSALSQSLSVFPQVSGGVEKSHYELYPASDVASQGPRIECDGLLGCDGAPSKLPPPKSRLVMMAAPRPRVASDLASASHNGLCAKASGSVALQGEPDPLHSPHSSPQPSPRPSPRSSPQPSRSLFQKPSAQLSSQPSTEPNPLYTPSPHSSPRSSPQPSPRSSPHPSPQPSRSLFQKPSAQPPPQPSTEPNPWYTPSPQIAEPSWPASRQTSAVRAEQDQRSSDETDSMDTRNISSARLLSDDQQPDNGRGRSRSRGGQIDKCGRAKSRSRSRPREIFDNLMGCASGRSAQVDSNDFSDDDGRDVRRERGRQKLKGRMKGEKTDSQDRADGHPRAGRKRSRSREWEENTGKARNVLQLLSRKFTHGSDDTTIVNSEEQF